MNEPKSTRYQRARRRSAAAALLVSAAVVCALPASGLAVPLRDATGGSAGAFALALALALEAAVLPAVWHRTFLLERHYGLSRVDPGAWLVDHAQGAAVTIAAAGAAAELAYGLMRALPGWWPVAASALGAAFAAAFTSLVPVLILPLFHRTRPLDREALRGRLVELSRRAGVPVLGVYEWGVGEETRRASAALVGVGATRRILLSSSLLADYADDEIEAVLAHEIGHHVHRDLAKALAAEFVVLLTGCLAAAAALGAAWPALGLSSPADPAGMPVLVLVLGAARLAAAPVSNALSRRVERRADMFALALVSSPDAFAGALRRMAAQNLAEERPSAASLLLFGTHPPVEERIRAARDVRTGLGAG